MITKKEKKKRKEKERFQMIKGLSNEKDFLQDRKV